jgi:hypothetical protein
MEVIQTEVLVVGGSTGGTAAAIQAARRGVQTLLVTEFPWLGGMLTAAGVAAPDGNELAAFQTGLWGAFLRELERRQPGGLDHAWVSFFTYDPAVGAAIFADWARALPALAWRSGHRPRAVLHQGDRITGVQFDTFTVEAQITLDGTELGDLLALAEMPHRWGWEPQSDYQEPSAPQSLSDPADPLYAVVQRYPVQAPTWVVVMQDYGDQAAPAVPAGVQPLADIAAAWAGYGRETFLNYGRLPGHRFMINWPQQGNDYGIDLDRLIASAAARLTFWQEAQAYSQGFAQQLQAGLGQRYGLAQPIFPQCPGTPGGGAFALYPYYRESRRLVGLTTVTEGSILPSGQVAPLPLNDRGEVSAIAIGNYPNDHHYPGFDFPLAPKSLRWGGRWTGTPFTIPYEALIPAGHDGFLVCEKTLSVSHIANGATRLQPVVLGIGQAAGMAAALCVEQSRSPRDLPVRQLQTALLTDPSAPLAVIPCFNLLPDSPQWVDQQQQYLDQPETYPPAGEIPGTTMTPAQPLAAPLSGEFQRLGDQQYVLALPGRATAPALVTLRPEVNQALQQLPDTAHVTVWGHLNPAGNWYRVSAIETP